MRFWLIVFLVILMPLQISWAATGRYCQHESGVSSTHFGHHSHRNQATEPSGELVKAITVELDCVTCHTFCSMASRDHDVIQKIALALMLAPQLIARSSHAPEDRPERPKWDALV